MLAARRLVETHLNASEVRRLVERPCELDRNYRFVWSIYQNFIKVDRWAEGIFGDLERMVNDSSPEFLNELRTLALKEIQRGRRSLQAFRELEAKIVAWCRMRHP